MKCIYKKTIPFLIVPDFIDNPEYPISALNNKGLFLKESCVFPPTF